MTVSEKKRRVTIEDFFSKKSNSDNSNVSKRVKTVASKDANNGDDKMADTKVVIKSKLEFRESLSSMLDSLLSLELETIEDSWFVELEEEFKKPYFVKLKQFVTSEQKSQTVFPIPKDIYSWSRLTPFDKVKVVIIGQDPYHNFNQAHGLAFSVKSPTPAPPSLKNIYKELKQNYGDFVIDNSTGDLTPWAIQGVLLLNTSLTVRAHNANSHSKKGWEQFTKKVVENLIKDREDKNTSLVFLLWGNNAINLVESILGKETNLGDNIKVFKSVHPSPLSASRGFFGNNHFRKINEWLYNERKEKMIDWSVVPGKTIKEVQELNGKL
ncbi:hypothetical protein Kpol_1004p43 [Vanderwaltozyma polyspora DSM 70294]|uniref:Uracil-DNA glycosylase n=1 Tax=Vanderwaltozyma polyspora (strain ATCC 22028 / DSM 70294 / BCRC 21397 / CBS 2163 / NBRC 10782 / NRRL Y-8283 / UCD 57-17) TaxID=436907 RepID=A7TJ99_VANPO|nr:uncharacterized protein Kpol_1004p43 [Vanderwaltozyma polyspora DSM 70294]EDO17668.1 hypothetical protein Kpol_1004p43 [Vanderwaltozyma polyspora DSM 70294]